MRINKIYILLSFFLFIGCSGPWEALSELYVTAENPNAIENIQVNKTIVLSGSNYKGSHSYKGIVKKSFSDKGIYLALNSPYSWFHKPILIPISAVSACSRTQWSPGWDTNLWISEIGIELSFPDNDKYVLNWCKKNDIEIVDREIARKWLYKSHSKQENNQ